MNKSELSRRIQTLVVGLPFLIVFICLLLLPSCEKEELTRSLDNSEVTFLITDTVDTDDISGISFDMESDSLKEEIEEVHFHAKEWEDEGMNVDL